MNRIRNHNHVRTISHMHIDLFPFRVRELISRVIRSWLYQDFLKIPRFIMKSGPVDVHIHDVMRRNIENFIWSSEVPPVRRLNVLMIDNVHCDKRVRPLLGGTARTGVSVGGVCRCAHSKFAPMHIRTTGDLYTLKDRCDGAPCGLLAEEITVCAIGAHHRTQYAPKNIYSSGSCKTGDQTSAVVTMIQTAFDIWYNDPDGYDKRGPLSTVWSDTAAQFAHAVHISTEAGELPPGHWMRQEFLATMALFDTRFKVMGKGQTPVAEGRDSMHVYKRIKAKGQSNSGGGIQTHGPGSARVGGSKLQRLVMNVVDDEGKNLWQPNEVNSKCTVLY